MKTFPVHPCGRYCCWDVTVAASLMVLCEHLRLCILEHIKDKETDVIRAAVGQHKHQPSLCAWEEVKVLCWIMNLFFPIWTFTSPALWFTSLTLVFALLLLSKQTQFMISKEPKQSRMKSNGILSNQMEWGGEFSLPWQPSSQNQRDKIL